ncbi:hypothetical protein MHU86_7620 [Fragilaria crotonensis]|nr:hypothetical protein MHU86_7620 [Fragilaria crotonensis]
MLFLNQEGISLQGKDSRLLLDANVRLEILRSNLTGKTLKRNLADQMFRSLLVMTNLMQSNGSRTVFARLHYASSGRSSLASCLGGCIVGGRLLTTRCSLLAGRGQTPGNKVISRHILKDSVSLSAGRASEARDPMRMLQALFLYPTPEGKGQHFGILIQVRRYERQHLEGVAIKRR